MSLENELVAQVKRYIASQITFTELVRWENQHETELLDLGPASIGGRLASSISMTAWELQEGHQTAESVRQVVKDELLAIAGAASDA
jgi:hypothetical protein